jgi:hypothetical protein
MIMRRDLWSFDTGLWVIYHGGGEVYEIILSSYFRPLLRRYCSACAIHRSPKGREIVFLRVILWSWRLDRGPWIFGLGLFNMGIGGIYNKFKLLFLISGPRTLGKNNLSISSTHLK